MNGLKLGDIILDPRGMVFLPSLRTLVCTGLRKALSSKKQEVIRSVQNKVDKALEKYKPETVIDLDPLTDAAGLSIIAKKWNSKTRFIFVSSNPDPKVLATAEKLKFEVHKELIWDKFRFLEKFEAPPFLDPKDMQAIDLQFLTFGSGAQYFLRVGHPSYDPFGLFTGKKLRVFLRGLGRFMIPSLDLSQMKDSLFAAQEDPFFSRYDVFAIGHSRILPLGKVNELQEKASMQILPVNVKTLGHRKPVSDSTKLLN